MKEKKKIIIIASIALIVIVIVLGFIIGSNAINNKKKYNQALEYLSKEEFEEGQELLIELGRYKDSDKKLSESRISYADLLIKDGKAFAAYKMISKDKSNECKEKVTDILNDYPILQFASKNIGETIVFGKYDTSSKTEGDEDLTWVILDESNGKLLIACTQAVFASPYTEAEQRFFSNIYANIFTDYIEKEKVEFVLFSEEQLNKYLPIDKYEGSTDSSKLGLSSFYKSTIPDSYWSCDESDTASAIIDKYGHLSSILHEKDGAVGVRSICWLDLNELKNNNELEKVKEVEKEQMLSEMERYIDEGKYREGLTDCKNKYLNFSAIEYFEIIYNKADSIIYTDTDKAIEMYKYLDDYKDSKEKLENAQNIKKFNEIE